MAKEIKQFAFNAGLWDSRLITRIDLDKYRYACQELTNFNLSYTGSIKPREGFKTVSVAALSKDTTETLELLNEKSWNANYDYVVLKTKIIPFFSDIEDHIIIARLHENKEKTWRGVVYFVHSSKTGKVLKRVFSTVITSTQIDSLKSIRYAQSNDELYITSDFAMPITITRNWNDENASFSARYFEFKYPPIKDFPISATAVVEDNTELVTGYRRKKITITIPDSEVRTYERTIVNDCGFLAIKSEKVRQITGAFDGDGKAVLDSKTSPWKLGEKFTVSPAMRATGKVVLYTSGKWQGKMAIEVSYDEGATWTVAASIYAPEDGSLAPQTSIDEDTVNALVRVRLIETGAVIQGYNTTNGETGGITGLGYYTVPTNLCKCEWSLTCYGEQVDWFEKEGSIKIPANSNTIVVYTPKPKIDTNPSGTLAISAFSKSNPPREVAISQQRLWFCGTKEEPKTVWGSEVDNLDVFKTGTKATSGLSFTPSSTTYDGVKWFKPIRTGFSVGCDRSELSVLPSGGSVITASSIQMPTESSWGCYDAEAVVAGDKIFYAKAGGRELMAQQYSFENNGYTSSSMNLYTRELFENDPIKKIEFSRLPNSSIYVLTEKGNLYRFIFSSEEDIFAWSKIELGKPKDFLLRCDPNWRETSNTIEIDDILIIRVDDKDKLFMTTRAVYFYMGVKKYPFSYSLLSNDSGDYIDHFNLIYETAPGNYYRFVNEVPFISSFKSMPLIYNDESAFGRKCVLSGADVYGNIACEFDYSFDGGKNWYQHSVGYNVEQENSSIVRNRSLGQAKLLNNGGYSDYADISIRINGSVSENGGDFELFGIGAEIV